MDEGSVTVIQKVRVCPICGSDQAERTREIYYMQGASTFLWRCQRCDYHFVDPVPTKEYLDEFYSNDYGCFVTEMQGWWASALVDRVRSVEHLQPSGRTLLDVGCGTGYFCLFAQKRGWKAWGVDPTEIAIRQAPAEIQDKLLTGTIESLDFPSGYFDVITFWAVIEHIVDPLNTIERAIDLLTPGGLLIFQLPFIRSLAARVYGSSWRLLAQSPDHVGFITPHTIGYLQKKYRLRLIRQRITGYPFPLGRIRNPLPEKQDNTNRSGSGRLLGYIVDNPPLYRAMRQMVHWLRLGDNIEFFLRKEIN